jgi:hypothetical protein
LEISCEVWERKKDKKVPMNSHRPPFLMNLLSTLNHYLQSCQLSQYRFRQSSILIIFLHFLQLDVLLIRAKRQVRSQARPVPDPDLGSVFETYFEWPTCNSNQKDYVNSKIRLLIDTSRHWRTSIKRFLKLVHLLRSIKWLLDKTMTKHIYLKSFLLVLNC